MGIKNTRTQAAFKKGGKKIDPLKRHHPEQGKTVYDMDADINQRFCVSVPGVNAARSCAEVCLQVRICSRAFYPASVSRVCGCSERVNLVYHYINVFTRKLDAPYI